MLGDIEQHAFRPKEFLLEIAGLLSVLALVDVVLGAEALELFRERVDILDEHAEMVDAAEIHPLAELVGLEFEDRHVERPVAQKHAIGEIAVRPADFLEIKGFLVELGHRLGVLGGDRDVAELAPRGLPALRMTPTYHARRFNPKRRIGCRAGFRRAAGPYPCRPAAPPLPARTAQSGRIPAPSARPAENASCR